MLYEAWVICVKDRDGNPTKLSKCIEINVSNPDAPTISSDEVGAVLLFQLHEDAQAHYANLMLRDPDIFKSFGVFRVELSLG